MAKPRMMGMPVVGGGERPLADFHAFCSKCGAEVSVGNCHPACAGARNLFRTLDGAVLDVERLASERPAA